MAAPPGNPSPKILRIFLVRHARPDVSRKGAFREQQASQFIRDYDSADIVAGAPKPAGLPYGKIGKVYCSTLNRSKRTAQALFGPEMPLVEDATFNEFERKILRLPLLRFPIDFWLTASRALWLLGLNSKGIETFRQAKRRARRAAEHLANQARQERQLVLVAHGFLNAFIRRELQKLGWQVVRKDGSGFLGVTELEKPESGGEKEAG
jgi:broad specificity phosphatase PhoE